MRAVSSFKDIDTKAASAAEKYEAIYFRMMSPVKKYPMSVETKVIGTAYTL